MKEPIFILSDFDGQNVPTHFPSQRGRVKAITPTGHVFIDPENRNKREEEFYLSAVGFDPENRNKREEEFYLSVGFE
jgi:hypothetical protein